MSGNVELVIGGKVFVATIMLVIGASIWVATDWTKINTEMLFLTAVFITYFPVIFGFQIIVKNLWELTKMLFKEVVE